MSWHLGRHLPWHTRHFPWHRSLFAQYWLFSHGRTAAERGGSPPCPPCDMPLSHALRRRSRRGEGEAQPYHLNQPYTSFLSERDEGGRPRRNKRGGHQMLDPSLASAATPRFFLYPPHSGEYLRRLVSCGVQQAQRCADSDATQMERNQGHRHHDSGVQARSCGATVAQLVNPIAADMRGGLGAEVLLCAAAERHQRRTNNIDEAQVVVMCPHLHYQYTTSGC